MWQSFAILKVEIEHNAHCEVPVSL